MRFNIITAVLAAVLVVAVAIVVHGQDFPCGIQSEQPSDLTSGGTINGPLVLTGAFDWADPITLAADATTIDASLGNVFLTQANTGATDITDITNDAARLGQTILICGGSSTNATTLTDAVKMELNGSYTLTDEFCIGLYIQADDVYQERFRNINPVNVTAAAVMADSAIIRGDGGSRGVQDSGVSVDDNDVLLNSTIVFSIGSLCTTSHSLVTGDACFGAGALGEFDDTVYFDAANAIVIAPTNDAVTPSLALDAGANSGFYSNQDNQLDMAIGGVRVLALTNLAITDVVNTDGGQFRLQESTSTAPVWTFRSDYDTGVARAGADILGFVAGGVSLMTLDEASTPDLATVNANFLGIGSVAYNGDNDKGALTTGTLSSESVTFPGGGAASQVTVGSLIPDGAILDGITTRVTTADNGGACTGYTVGDGVDIDLYGVAATETQGTTTTPTSATASISNPQFGGPYEVTITGTGGNCIDMVVAITAHYRLLTAATAN